MSQSEHVVNATDDNFQAVVLEESKKRPVVVDFWAPWCGPCRALTPVLERLTEEAGGKFLLVKVNTDENPNVAQSFQIRGIPAVKAFRDGAMVNEFTGALPEGQIRQWLEDVVPSEARKNAEAALAAFQTGSHDEALRLAELALHENPRLAPAQLVKAEVALARGDAETARAALDAIVDDTGLESAVAMSRAKLELLSALGDAEDEPTLRRRLEAGPDPDAALGVAAYEGMAGRVEGAFSRTLDVFTDHRKTHKEPAHKLALALIALAPEDIQRDMRRKLSMLLF